MINDEIMIQAVSKFDSHDVINWIVKNKTKEYVNELKRIRKGSIGNKRCEIAPPEFRNEIIQFGRGAKELNRKISEWIRDHRFLRNGRKKSANLWGEICSNQGWKRPSRGLL